MIKIETINGQTKSLIEGRPHNIAIEFETLCENLLEQGYFNANDLACMLALACAETSSEKVPCSLKQALNDLVKKL
jgi:hypothetical protein